MAAKSAALDRMFTEAEMKKMDPLMLERIKTGVEYAIDQAGGKVANPKLTQANFRAIKKELLALKPGPIKLRPIR